MSLTLSITSLYAACAAILFTAGLGLFYRLFWAPLSGLPGPWWTSLTRLWLIYHEFKGDRTVTIELLHRTYGPVVRIAPDEVSFNTQDAIRDIYGIKSDLGKSDFYDLFIYYNERNTFTSLSKAEHSQRKRLVADRYTKSYVMQPAVAEEVRKHAASFMRIVKDSPVLDVYAYSHYYVMDAITGHVYGPSGTKTLTETEHRPLVYDLSGQKHRTRLYLHHYLKSPMAAISTVSSLWRRFRTGNDAFHVRGDRLNAYGRDSVESARSTLSDKNSTDVCSKLLRVTGNCPQTAAECMDHMVAGVDTTGDALCVLMWQLSLPESRHIQEKLFEELRSVESAFDAETMTAPISLLDSLPYLDAVIREGLRWRAPVPMTLFRVVPHGGRTISGVPIPARTVVGCQAYSIHQLPEVFEAPDRFVPDRWLTEDQEKLNAMRAHFWPFSSGARHCLGHNIAMVEMKHLIASVYTYYKTSTTPECTEESMAMDDQLTSGVPYGLKCVLAFEKR